jgi:hypothetical protein
MSIAAIALLAGLLAVGAGLGLYRRVLAAPATNARANEIADAIRTGANAFLRRQYRTVGMVGVPIFLAVGSLLGWWTDFNKIDIGIYNALPVQADAECFDGFGFGNQHFATGQNRATLFPGIKSRAVNFLRIATTFFLNVERQLHNHFFRFRG